MEKGKKAAHLLSLFFHLSKEHIQLVKHIQYIKHIQYVKYVQS